jgi:hypothetical protein
VFLEGISPQERPPFDKEGRMMMRLIGTVMGLALALAPTLAHAEGAGGSYRGIAQIYFTFITAVLIYGVHDTFHNRKITLVGAVVIIGVMFGVLLPKG